MTRKAATDMNTRRRVEKLGREIEEKMQSLHALVSKLAPEGTETCAVEINCASHERKWMVAFHKFDGPFYLGYAPVDVLTVLDKGIEDGLQFPKWYTKREAE